MKRFFLAALASITFLGAGCSVAGIPLISSQVSGNWYLSFEMPDGWIMAKPYSEPNEEAVTVSTDVNHTLNEVTLSSTSKAVVAGGVKPDDTVPVDTYVSDDFSLIHVYRLDTHRIIPSEAEDLGGGFYRLKLCEDDGDCRLGGRYNYEYYLVTETGKYKFTIQERGQDEQNAIDIIMSAKEVTNFTDGASVDATTK
jgi:hypothetical protein